MATTLRSLDRWLAVSWGLVVVSLLIVRWSGITALNGVLSVRTVVVFTILLAVMSTARDPQFRQLLSFVVLTSLVAVAALGWFGPHFVDGGLILEVVLPFTGYLVLGLMAAKIVAAALGEAIGHPYDCECSSTNHAVRGL